MINIKLLPAYLFILAVSNAIAGGVVVIGHADVGKLDAATVQKIFTGKLIQVEGVEVTAVNLKPGPLRDRFLQTFLNQTEDKYTIYWAKRLFVGKGAPPLELSNTADVIKFVRSTPGAIGYVDEADVLPEVHVIVR
jgi:ABC-type phosphate transport system substrate-binding protein